MTFVLIAAALALIALLPGVGGLSRNPVPAPLPLPLPTKRAPRS